MKKILIIEDDEAIAMALEDDLISEGYHVQVAMDGIQGLKVAMGQQVDLILLDLMLPGMNGIDICKRLREKKFFEPIIMLTAKSQDIDKILGLEFGADDYVTKPYSPGELKARIRALLRRTKNMEASRKLKTFVFGTIKVDFDSYILEKNGVPVKLTALEFSLLEYFLVNQGRVLTRDDILDEVWQEDVMVNIRTVDTHVANLRKKIEVDSSDPKWIIGIRGIGYKMIIE